MRNPGLLDPFAPRRSENHDPRPRLSSGSGNHGGALVSGASRAPGSSVPGLYEACEILSIDLPVTVDVTPGIVGSEQVEEGTKVMGIDHAVPVHVTERARAACRTPASSTLVVGSGEGVCRVSDDDATSERYAESTSTSALNVGACHHEGGQRQGEQGPDGE